MGIKRIMIAAPKSGSGKTVITCAFLQILKDEGYQVASFKCGPDYIDPMFHEKVIGVPSKNLDTFFTGEEQTRRIFLQGIVEKDFAVLEGVMGLYDGLGGIREEGSSYHLAKVTGTPIVLVVDTKGMGRSVIPMIAGFLDYDRAHLIRGVLFNRITKGFYETIKPLIEEELKVPVLGFLSEKEELRIESRHLGLMMPDELNNVKGRLQAAAIELQKTVSIERMMEIAEGAEELQGDGAVETARNKGKPDKPVIAVAKDEAFCFYYMDNLSLLEENGAEITYFSPLRDPKLPERCHALYLGGGYPELYAKELSENSEMRTAIRSVVENGMPVVAECGGFMYLHSAIIDREGIRHEMAGIFSETCYDTGKLVRFGYIELQEKQSHFLPEGETIKGHEFHYYDSTGSGEDAIALKPVTGRTYSCMIENEKLFCGFPHLYYPSNPAFAKSFVEKAGRYKRELEQESYGKFVSIF